MVDFLLQSKFIQVFAPRSKQSLLYCQPWFMSHVIYRRGSVCTTRRYNGTKWWSIYIVQGTAVKGVSILFCRWQDATCSVLPFLYKDRTELKKTSKKFHDQGILTIYFIFLGISDWFLLQKRSGKDKGKDNLHRLLILCLTPVLYWLPPFCVMLLVPSTKRSNTIAQTRIDIC